MVSRIIKYGSGYGDGSGYGSGYGSGDGSGSGSDSGYGSGYGDGYSSGYGYGYGSGGGFGFGSGYGYGGGGGFGSDSGYGYGDSYCNVMRVGYIAGYDIYLITPWRLIRIGCERMTAREWKSNWRELAIENGVQPTDDLAKKVSDLLDRLDIRKE